MGDVVDIWMNFENLLWLNCDFLFFSNCNEKVSKVSIISKQNAVIFQAKTLMRRMMMMNELSTTGGLTFNVTLSLKMYIVFILVVNISGNLFTFFNYCSVFCYYCSYSAWPDLITCMLNFIRKYYLSCVKCN